MTIRFSKVHGGIFALKIVNYNIISFVYLYIIHISLDKFSQTCLSNYVMFIFCSLS